MTAQRDDELPREGDSIPAPSGPRTVPPTQWRDAMLALAADLPEDADSLTVARRVVDTLAALLPGCLVGASVAGSPSDEPEIVASSPVELAKGDGSTPTRLFAKQRFERVFAIGDRSVDATLHLAGDALGVTSSAPELLRTAEGAALVFGMGLAQARRSARERANLLALEHLRAEAIQTGKLASLGHVVAGVVHELNNPLTTIMAYSDHLLGRAQARGDAEDEERLRRVAEAAARILAFARDLIDYARPSGERAAPVRLATVLDKALAFSEHDLRENRVELERSASDPELTVEGVASQLVQLFVNLFVNAAHAMSAHGGVLSLTVTASREGRLARIDVADQGVGMDPATLSRIYDPFFTTKPNGRGTGLGLSIIRKIVDAHGGTLSVESAPGHGTVFTLELPLAR